MLCNHDEQTRTAKLRKYAFIVEVEESGYRVLHEVLLNYFISFPC